MGLYDKYLLPGATHLVCSSPYFDKKREMVVSMAYGSVLEVGFGTGLNLPYYRKDKIKEIHALDPSEGMFAIAEKKFDDYPFPVRKLVTPAEEIPLDDHSVDSAVSTYTMCTIGSLTLALTEIKRVLKPGGQLFFCEHGASPKKPVRLMQDLFNPVWKPLAGGCNLNRPIFELIEDAGFRVEPLLMRGPDGSLTRQIHYIGIARVRE